MKKFKKQGVPREEVKRISEKFGISSLEASILYRRGITEGKDLLYFLEDDSRFIHEPFLLTGMDDAVERILQAKDENEKIMIFGDRDVDGITSTAILYGFLKRQGYDVIWRIPNGEDSYGLSLDAVNSFAENYGSLIITVDCGISNVVEIARANELGINVIVTDHHNPPENLPDASIIIDPKMEDENYQFKDISGAAVAFKLVQALRFAKTDFYNQEYCFINTIKTDNSIKIECAKLKNLVKISELTVEIPQWPVSFMQTKLNNYLKSQIICVWNEKQVKEILTEAFGRGIEFSLYDVQPEICSMFPSLSGKNLTQLKNISKIARYSEKEITEVQGLLNLYITYIQKATEKKYPETKENSLKDMQLVAMAALADIMPLKNENRIFVKTGIESINQKPCKGLSDLFARMDLLGKPVTSSTLGWKVNPALNAAGRVGQSNIAVELLTEDSAENRQKLAQKIIEFNEIRKSNVSDAELFAAKLAQESVSEYNGTLCVVADERINKGITGLLAGRFVSRFQVPSLVLTYSEDKSVCAGSLRSCRGCIATDLLNQFDEDFFINHGGHNCAAGFSFESSKINQFKEKLREISRNLILTDEDETISIDAEIPAAFMTPELCKTVDKFEPYGEQNPELIFYSQNLTVIDAQIVGKSEPQHLKLVFDCGEYKFPAMFWGEAERLNRDFKVKDKLNILYTISKNVYNGNTTPQLIIVDAEKSY